MRLWLPLLVMVSSCSNISAAVFQVNVSQQLYEAQENQNVQLEWTFTTSPHTKMSSLSIYCGFHGLEESLVYHVVEGVEHPQTENNNFTGRVQCDTEALREGRIRLHLSRVRCADSGIYYCNVFTEDGRNAGNCRLNVSAAVVTTERGTGAADWQSNSLHTAVALSATASLLLVLSVCAGAIKCSSMRRRRQRLSTRDDV